MTDFSVPQGPDQWGVSVGDEGSNYLNAGTGENDVPATASLTHNWVNPGQILTAALGNSTLDSGGGAPYIFPFLRGSNYGFSVPGTATILGIETEIFHANNVGGYTEEEVRLCWGVSAVNLSTTNQVSGGTIPDNIAKVYGGPTDLWGELTSTLTPTVINSSDFGLCFKAGRSSGSTGIGIGVDSMRIKVFFSDSAADGSAITTQAYAEVIMTRVDPAIVTQAYAEVIRVAPSGVSPRAYYDNLLAGVQ